MKDGEIAVVYEIEKMLKSEELQRACWMWERGYICLHELMVLVSVEIGKQYEASEIIAQKIAG